MTTERKLLILNGPGLADIGNGSVSRCNELSLPVIRDGCAQLCSELGISQDFRQSDSGASISEWIADVCMDFAALLINPYEISHATHALRLQYCAAIEQISDTQFPVVEIHLTNIFRSDAELTGHPQAPNASPGPLQARNSKIGFVGGMGIHSYLLAIKSAVRQLDEAES